MRRGTAIAASTALGAAVAVSLTSVAFAADGRGFDGMGHRRGGGFLMLLLLVAAIALLIVLLWRNRHPATATPTAPPPAATTSPTLNAQTILADRLARGEISPDDYRAAVAVLREPSTPG